MKNRPLRRTLLLLMAAGIVGVGAYGLYWLGMRHGMTMADGSAVMMAGAVAAKAERTPLYWHDPMVPGQKFDKPGKSPFMDMELVPVYADDADDNGQVTISARVQQNLGIRLAEVVHGELPAAFQAVGSVVYNERDVALVQARSNGFVERLHVRAALDPVKQGQALAELYAPDWVATQEDYLTARRLRAKGTDAQDGVVEAARQRMALAGMSEAQIGVVEASGKLHARITLTAPISGVITELAVREGMTVMAGAPMFRINGLGTVWVNADVPENFAAQVRPGQAVEARTPALPGTVFKGKVGAILPEVNVATRTIKARIELSNPSGQLVPGMFATLNFASTARKKVLLMPSEAVIQTGTRSVVMIAQGDGKFKPVDVELGAEANGQSEIRRGLEAGQKVVVSGQFLVDSEASLKGTATRMSDMPQADGGEADAVHHGEGRLESIGSDEITISHGPIPSMQWGPMTMGFKPPPGGLPGDVSVGDSVNFAMRATKDGEFEITSISRASAPKPTGAKP